MVKAALLFPAGMLTLPGTVIAALLLVRETVRELDAALFSIIVQAADAFKRNAVGEQSRLVI